MRMLRVVGLLVALLSVSPVLIYADTLTLGAVGPSADGPKRGSTMVDVEATIGPPESTSGPVGDPPITVWHYTQFNVYFEYDKVLHSVESRQP
ncbi:MAG: hypothetical protein BMS9Abin01_0336 [Gammaproteobacteria bacterium]|nr:MAG: hypothetical protein BMS9Abin01_0336 [Gammaproteobacteria bacterium]